MESLLELKLMDGLEKSENLFLSGLDNMLYKDYEIQEIRESLVNHPKILKKFNNSLIPTVYTYTLQFKYNRFGNGALYRINEKYTQTDK